MWKCLQSSFHISIETVWNANSSTGAGFEILVTDFISLWSAQYTNQEFLSSLKDYNEDLEFENDSEWTQKGMEVLSNPEKLKKLSIIRKDDSKILSISVARSFGYLIMFECTLNKGSEELFFQKITKSLIITVEDLRSSQTELRHMLIKKDKEIMKYKQDNGDISLRHLKTVEYNDQAHMDAYNYYEKIFGASGVPTELLCKTVKSREPLQSNHVVKTEPVAVKMELETQNVNEGPNLITNTTIPSSDIKQELVKNESQSSINRKKRIKVNY